jgi:hypothetical protein
MRSLSNSMTAIDQMSLDIDSHTIAQSRWLLLKHKTYITAMYKRGNKCKFGKMWCVGKGRWGSMNTGVP